MGSRKCGKHVCLGGGVKLAEDEGKRWRYYCLRNKINKIQESACIHILISICCQWVKTAEHYLEENNKKWP